MENRKQMPHNKRPPLAAAPRWLATALALSTTIGLIGCGSQEFHKTTSTQSQISPGTFSIPPKVDILLAEDDTGSMNEGYETIATQVPNLLKSLDSQGWDYHFATIPLTKARTITQIVASRHDGNWGSQWVAPYPGAPIDGPGTVNASFFREPDDYTAFLGLDDINNSLNSLEPGFANLWSTLSYEAHVRNSSLPIFLRPAASTSNFLRQDALLVILVVGNGEDTSGVTFCDWNGTRIPCEYTTNSSAGTLTSSFNDYKTKFLSTKLNASQVKFYAAVAAKNSPNCLGSSSYVGTRYQKMAKELGGESYDVCTRPVQSVLASMSEHLQTQRLAMRLRYLFVDTEPEVSSIRVIKYPGGDTSQPIELTQDPDNGWTYAGNVTDVYAIDSPTNLNLSSGYAIELHGTAKLLGADTADVQFSAAGARDSAQ